MRNKTANIEVIKTVARALGDINNRVVYVGGTVVALYADDPAAEDVRPTKDIDLVAQIVSIKELSQLEEKLGQRGFSRDPTENLICRFRLGNILVDVMSTVEIGWAPSNRWFKSGMKHLRKVDVGDIEINILDTPHFLAAKFEAFSGRGQNDPRTSQDFEDIVYILDNNVGLAEEVLKAPTQVRKYLAKWFEEITESPTMKEALEAHLPYETRAGRIAVINDKLHKITKSYTSD